MIDRQTALSDFTVTLNVIIRPATPDDLPGLEWFGQFWRYRNLFRHTYEEQKAGRRLMLVADLNGFPVGRLFVQIGPANPLYADGWSRGYLYSLHVMTPLHGQGIGTQLIRTAEHLLTEHGYTWATIAAAKDNPRARRLYNRLGYVCFHEDPGEWSYIDPDGVKHQIVEPCWVFEKRLTEESTEASHGDPKP